MESYEFTRTNNYASALCLLMFICLSYVVYDGPFFNYPSVSFLFNNSVARINFLYSKTPTALNYCPDWQAGDNFGIADKKSPFHD